MKEHVRNAIEGAGIEERGGGWWKLPDGRRVRGGANALRTLRSAQNSNLKVERMRFARRAGLQYAGERDIYEVAGYVQEDKLDFAHYWSRYQRQDIAGALVDMAPQATWRNPPSIVQTNDEGDELETSEFVSAFDDLAKRVRLWSRLERADRMARIGEYGVLLIGVPGDDRELAEEMPTLNGADDILYLSHFREGDVDIEEWVTDTADPRFGLPKLYEIDLSSGVQGFPEARATVHWSRTIHIAEDLLADEVFGRPALKRVFNRLMDLEKVTAATGEAFWQLADKILQAKIDPEAQIGEDALKDFGGAMEEIMHDLRRQITVQGGELSWLGGDTPDPKGPADLLMTLIAASANPPIPKRILFGSETGERASTEDQKTWLGRIKERDDRFSEPVILRPLIDRLVRYGALPQPGEAGYDVVWPNRFEVPEKDEADLSETRARTAKHLTPVGGDPREMVTIDEDNTVHLRTRTDEDAEALEAEAATVPDITPPPEAGEAQEDEPPEDVAA